MTKVLILLAVSNEIRAEYANRLTDVFPHLNVVTCDHHSKAMSFIDEIEVLMTFGPQVSRPMMDAATGLKWIQSLGTGVDGLADQPALPDDVIVTRVHGISAPMAEMVLGSMLALSRNMSRAFDNQKKGLWQRHPSRLLFGKTVGVLGIGVIAEAVAPRCKAFGMRVVGLTSSPRAVPGFDEVLPIDQLQAVVPQLDYLIVLTPYSDATHGLVSRPVIEAMKLGSYVVNVARGGILDEGALVDALDAGRLAGAALDVFEQEPLPASHPLWATKNLIVTPHIGGLCDVYPELAMPTVIGNMRHYLAKDFGRMVNRVARQSSRQS
jgi:D-2-hydroxyacid dehydrogenase (NADP+)